MAHRSRRLQFVTAVAFALAGACDTTGFLIEATVTVPEEIAAAYSPIERGLLLVRFEIDGHGTDVSALGIVCGEAVTTEIGAGYFGRLPDSSVSAWIAPLPADDERPCGLFSADEIETDDVEANEDEPQTSAQVRAAQGCESDHVAVELELTAPK